MEIIRDIMTTSSLIPAGKTVANVTLAYKGTNTIHAGHNYILNMSRGKGDYLMVNFAEQQQANAWFGLPYDNSVIDEVHCIDWCRKNLVDYVQIISCDLIGSLNQQYETTSIKAQADTIFNDEGYGRFNLIETWVNSIKFVIGIHLLLKRENKLYDQAYRIRSWNDGIYAFILKHFYNTYYKPIDVVHPVRDENGLIISSSLLGKPQEMKDGMIFIRDQVEAEFAKGNRDMRAMMISINTKVIDQNLPVRLTSVKYYQEAITDNKILTTFGVHSMLDGKTYFLSEYFYYF